MHHAGAAAVRRVVDAAVPVGRVLAQVVHPHVEATLGPRPAEQRRVERPVEVLGEDGEHVDAHGTCSVAQRSSSPSGGSITSTPSRCSTTNTIGHQRAAVEHEQVVGGIRLDRGDASDRCAGAVDDLGADQLVHPQLVVVEHIGVARERVRGELHPQQPLGRGAVVDPVEVHEQPALVAPGGVDDQLALARRTAPRRARCARDGCC